MEFSNDWYKTIFNLTSDSIIVISKKGEIIDVNDSASKLLGYKKEEVKGMKLSDLTQILPPKSMAIILKNFGLRMLGKKIEPYEVELKRKDSDVVHVLINAVHLKDKGKIVGEIASMQDVTAYKKLVNNLEEKNEELESFNKVSVDRELKMVELKEKIKELEAKQKVSQ